MGKQIEFFITKKDEIEFLRMVLEYKGIVVNDKGAPMTLKEVENSNALSLFIIQSDAYINKSTSGFIDAIVSDAVQFSRGFRSDEGAIRSSRLWVELKYYDSNNNLITKRKQLSDMFNTFANYIKKNFKHSKCKRYYIGDEAHKLHKESGYIMLAGPKYKVEFD